MQQGIFEKSITVTPDYCDAAAQLSPLRPLPSFRASPPSTPSSSASAARRWRSAASSG
ncbi:MAG: hypothetical protein ACLR4W_10595 [Oscillospiraceae bacterium]